MDTLAFWLPLFLLFFSALLGALIKRRSCDHCLKKFAGKEVLIELDSEHWISGELQVFAQGIELIMPDEKVTPFSSVHSRIIHSSEVEKIPLFIRQAPDPDTRSGVEWHKEREKLLNPPFFKCFQRASLNSYNMLRFLCSGLEGNRGDCEQGYQAWKNQGCRQKTIGYAE